MNINAITLNRIIFCCVFNRNGRKNRVLKSPRHSILLKQKYEKIESVFYQITNLSANCVEKNNPTPNNSTFIL